MCNDQRQAKRQSVRALSLVAWTLLFAIFIDAVSEDKHFTPAWVSCFSLPFLPCAKNEIAVDDFRDREQKNLRAKNDEHSQGGKHLTDEMNESCSGDIAKLIND
jgi:hypothetical protein